MRDGRERETDREREREREREMEREIEKGKKKKEKDSGRERETWRRKEIAQGSDNVEKQKKLDKLPNVISFFTYVLILPQRFRLHLFPSPLWFPNNSYPWKSKVE